LCFIGGIIDLLNVVKVISQGNDFSALLVATGITKIIFAGAAGFVSAIAFILPGISIFNKK